MLALLLARLASADWLVTPPATSVTLEPWSGTSGLEGLTLTNGLISRKFALSEKRYNPHTTPATTTTSLHHPPCTPTRPRRRRHYHFGPPSLHAHTHTRRCWHHHYHFATPLAFARHTCSPSPKNRAMPSTKLGNIRSHLPPRRLWRCVAAPGAQPRVGRDAERRRVQHRRPQARGRRRDSDGVPKPLKPGGTRSDGVPVRRAYQRPARGPV